MTAKIREMKVESFTVDTIQVRPRLRPVDPAVVATLADSMKQLGQIQPITAYTSNDGVVYLVAGAHRLEAAKRLGWEDIDVVFITGNEIDRELCEIAENLHRAELTALERDTQVARWLELTAATQSEVSVQSAPKPKGGRPEGGTNAASRELGIESTDAKRAVKVASISQQAKQAARDAGLDDNRTALLAVAKESTPEAQVAKVGAIASAKNAAKAKNQPSATNVVAFQPQALKEISDDAETDADEIDGVNMANASNRAHAIGSALSTIDAVGITAQEFWVLYGTEHLKPSATIWLDSALEKLDAIKKGVPGVKLVGDPSAPQIVPSADQQPAPPTNPYPDYPDLPACLDRRKEARACANHPPMEAPAR